MFTVRGLMESLAALRDRAKVTQVRLDFSRTVAPRIRLASLRSGGLSPVEPRRRGRLRKGFGKSERSGQGPGGY